MILFDVIGFEVEAVARGTGPDLIEVEHPRDLREFIRVGCNIMPCRKHLPSPYNEAYGFLRSRKDLRLNEGIENPCQLKNTRHTRRVVVSSRPAGIRITVGANDVVAICLPFQGRDHGLGRPWSDQRLCSESHNHLHTIGEGILEPRTVAPRDIEKRDRVTLRCGELGDHRPVRISTGEPGRRQKNATGTRSDDALIKIPTGFFVNEDSFPLKVSNLQPALTGQIHQRCARPGDRGGISRKPIILDQSPERLRLLHA